ncbi:nuclear transport factor 2 family protein [Streptomyces sp. NPDC006512]|uniref:nuclear transport factor 2 family protein n=1 Tax=Streptomyces sp. NPDC006512 TaxID=3154307 RepID=UPI0033B83B4C
MLPRPNELLARYVALWNETDPARRRERVEALYAPDAVYVFYRKDPIRGHAAILDQLAYTHQVYGPMGYEFRSSNNATGHHDVVRFNWVMVSAATGEMEMSGQDIVVLAEDGRIQADYQFHDRMPSSFVYDDGYEEHGVAVRAARPRRTGVAGP